MTEQTYCHIDSPIGRLTLISNGVALSAILFAEQSPPQQARRGSDAVLQKCCQQLEQYFAGQRQEFDLPLAPAGTDFQQQAWRALCGIPYGETRSYRQQAEAIGKPTAVRAIGAANGRNPIPVVIPCHRVIGSDGSLTGYAGGVKIKQQLLALERALP